ncbi:MAG: hypothetical protein CMJ34_02675 [Phycisphaerae bacterium]|nr:hypothetical protein [Phycisphaerae bacterium]
MTPENRRRIVSAVILLLAVGLVALAMLRPRAEDAPFEDAPTPGTTPTKSLADTPAESPEVAPPAPIEEPIPDGSAEESEKEPPPPPSAVTPADDSPAEVVKKETEEQPETAVDAEATPAASGTLVARAPGGASFTPKSLGGLDPTRHRFLISFSGSSAGIDEIVFSEFWTEASFARAATRHQRTDGESPMPPEDERYRLRATPYGDIAIPLLAARAIEIDGMRISLFGPVWTQSEPGHFHTEIVDEEGRARFRVERRFTLPPNGYDLTLEQRVTNLGAEAAEVRWIQYGPGDLDRDRGSFIEVRRFHFGYLLPVDRDPNQANVTSNGQLYERSAVLDRIDELYALPASSRTSSMLNLWPNDESMEQSLALSWFGTTNRYFTICVHAVFDPPDHPSRLATGSIESIRPTALTSLPQDQQDIVTELHGPVKTVEPGVEANWDMGLYAGPLERSVLMTGEPYVGLNMKDLIVYLMSGCCSFCTFSWLADGLVVFLGFLHGIVFDWAIAIVLLVCIVRLILHPVMKKGQIQMQRVGKLMTALKPELDALQKKYKDDPAKMQAEQRRLFMERGVNPLGCVGGLLPTFLQMPIWIALYAMLFFAFELRQEPAFFGIFQLLPDVMIGSSIWFGQFLGDLSRPDHFIEFGEPVNVFGITKLTGFNLLPILMGAIFFIQQKYMSPPPSPNTTPEQLQQQKIMKVMMVILFPVMLFQAPSGLTLYILTSSTIGIFESKRIRKQVDAMDLTAPPAGKSGGEKRKGKRDQLARMYAEKLEEAKKKQAAKRKGSQKSFKKRDG